MKKIIPLLLFFNIFLNSVSAQSWSKQSNFPQEFSFLTIQTFSKGDTIVLLGRDYNDSSKYPFYISTNSGKTWMLEETALTVTGSANYNPIQILPKNDLILGFSSTSVGTYSFQQVGNWQLFLRSAMGSYAEFSKGSLLFSDYNTGDLYKLNADGSGTTKTNVKFLFKTFFNNGNRLFLGSNNGVVKYIDGGDVANIQTATFTPALVAGDGSTHFFKDAHGNLFASFSNGSVKIYKSSDDGATWSQVLPAGLETNIGCVTTDLVMDDDHNFYITSSSCKNRLYKSTDNCVSFSPYNTGLPTEGNNYYFTKTSSDILVTALTLGSLPWNAENTGFYALKTVTAFAKQLENQNVNAFIKYQSGKAILVIEDLTENFKLEIYNSMGKTLLSKEVFETHTELSTLSTSGIYIIKLNGKNTQLTQRILIP